MTTNVEGLGGRKTEGGPTPEGLLTPEQQAARNLAISAELAAPRRESGVSEVIKRPTSHRAEKKLDDPLTGVIVRRMMGRRRGQKREVEPEESREGLSSAENQAKDIGDTMLEDSIARKAYRFMSGGTHDRFFGGLTFGTIAWPTLNPVYGAAKGLMEGSYYGGRMIGNCRSDDPLEVLAKAYKRIFAGSRPAPDGRGKRRRFWYPSNLTQKIPEVIAFSLIAVPSALVGKLIRTVAGAKK